MIKLYKIKIKTVVEDALFYCFFCKVWKNNKSFKMIHVSKFLFAPLSFISY